MQRIDEDAVVDITSGHDVTPVNGFSEGDPTVPRQGTQVSADWLNQVQEEILNVVEEAGLTPDSTFVQLLAAIRVVALDAKGSAGQNVVAQKNFQNGITVTRTTANASGISGTGNGSGIGVAGAGGSGTNGAPGLSGVGGTCTTGNGGTGAQLLGTGFNAAATGNTTGAAGAGATVTGGSISSDTNGRVGGTGLIVSGGTGQAGRGKAIDAQNGDVNVGNGNLNVSGAATVGSLTMNAPTTVASMPGGFTNSFADGSALSSGYVPAAWVDPMGMKHVVGEIGGTGTSGQKAFTLDTPFKPSKFFSVTAINGAGGTAQIDFQANGDVFVHYTAGSVNVHIPPLTYL